MGTLLHLSDLHLATQPYEDSGDYKSEVIDPTERQARRQEIKSTLAALGRYLREAGITLDAVVVSGDVTYQHDNAGFKALRPVLRELKTSLPPKERIVVVPGNHDVQWGTKASSAARYERFVSRVRTEFGYRTPLLEGVDISGSNGTKRAGATNDNPVLDCTDAGFVVVAINSANYCGVVDPDHPSARLSPTALANALDSIPGRAKDVVSKWLADTRFDDIARISPGQMEALKRVLHPYRDNDVVVVAVLHHHLLPVSTSEEIKRYSDLTNLGQFREFLSENADVVLHGHKHTDRVYLDHVDIFNVADRQRGQSLVLSSGTSGTNHGGITMRLLTIGPGEATRCVRVSDIAAVQAGGSVQPRDRGARYLPNRRTTMPSFVSEETRTVEGATASKCYEALVGLFEQVRKAGQARSDVFFRNLKCVVLDGTTCAHQPEGYPDIPGSWPGWFEQTVEWWQGNERQEGTGYNFTHGERIENYGGWFSQIEAAAKALSTSKRKTSRGTIALIEPTHDLTGNQEFPSFCLVQPRIESDTLHITGVFRKQEMHYWWPINLAELASLQKRLAAMVTSATHDTIGIGSITTFAEYAKYSDAPPRAVVPLLDRLNDAGPDEDRVVAMAYAAVHGGAQSESARRDWALVLAQWAPPEARAADGDPISLVGTERLAQLVRLFEQDTNSRVLGDHLHALAEANERFFRAQRGDATSLDSAFNQWKTAVAGRLPKIQRIITARLGNG